MAKVYTFDDKRISFVCPGCGNYHVLNTPDNIKWTWNGDTENPTIRPSIHKINKYGETICHNWVTDGKIEFLMDSNHELKGKTVGLPELQVTK